MAAALGEITEKVIDGEIETILHTILKFHFDCACFQSEEASANFGVSNNNNAVTIPPVQG